MQRNDSRSTEKRDSLKERQGIYPKNLKKWKGENSKMYFWPIDLKIALVSGRVKYWRKHTNCLKSKSGYPQG